MAKKAARKTARKSSGAAKKRASAKRPARRGRPGATDTINCWEQDPGSAAQPTGGPIIQRPVPVIGNTPYPTRIENPATAPAPGSYSAGSSQFRYWAAADALRRGSDFWGALLPDTDWEVGDVLPVDLYHGNDLNAYYDRVGLRFFQDDAGGRTVYSGESPDVVCHELGHAILDSFKPQLWDAASMEVASFHESFGDMSALLCGLQLQSLRLGVLQETGNVVYRASRLSRLAEQLGWAIRQSVPSAVESDCLRNAVNTFFYRDPNTLPTQAPASVLSSEPHSFSRVFTAAFFEGLAGMFTTGATRDEAALLKVSQDAGRILVDGVRAATVVPGFYSQVAASMLRVAQSRFGAQSYEQALRSAFVRHGILPPAMALTVSTAPPPAAAAAAAVAAQAAERELPRHQMSVAEYGLGVPAIMVMSASQPKVYDVAGASLAIGPTTAPAEDVAAKAFFEDLLRRGRLKVADAAEPRAEILRAAASRTHPTHTHELRKEGGQVVLRRVRIDCCFCCR